MAKLKDQKIEKRDLVEFLNGYSDFSFELSVLKMLRAQGYECKHGGHYQDPVTKKSREFDIRLTAQSDNRIVKIAVECKNIRENFPIFVSNVPRHASESFHQVVYSCDSIINPLPPMIQMNMPRARLCTLNDVNSLYGIGQPVGKSTTQVGRAVGNSIFSGDSELYEKWGQSLSSLDDLIVDMYRLGSGNDQSYLSMAIPIVVIPDGRLWSATYDNDGTLVSEPEQVSRSSCFVGKKYEYGADMKWFSYKVSHLEIMTISELERFCNSYLGSKEAIDKLFPTEVIETAYTNYRASIRSKYPY